MSNNIKLLKILLFASFLLILFAGLRLKDVRLTESIVHGDQGLSGSLYTIAETGDFIEGTTIDSMRELGFIVRLLVRLPEEPPQRFTVISSVTDGSSDSQFLIGQWRETLVVMNGDDYSSKLGKPAMFIDTTLLSDEQRKQSMELVVRTLHDGSEASINGVTVVNNPDFSPLFEGVDSAQLTFANSSLRQHGWPGDLQTFDLELADSGGEIVSYDMRENPVAVSSKDVRADIVLPPNYKVSKPVFLSTSTAYLSLGLGTVFDVLINFGGFVPFGYLLFCVSRIHNQRRKTSWIIFVLTICAGITLSLVIEFAQAYIPSRNSSLYDLLLNSFGVILGAYVGLSIHRSRQQVKDRDRRLSRY